MARAIFRGKSTQTTLFENRERRPVTSRRMSDTARKLKTLWHAPYQTLDGSTSWLTTQVYLLNRTLDRCWNRCERIWNRYLRGRGRKHGRGEENERDRSASRRETCEGFGSGECSRTG